MSDRLLIIDDDASIVLALRRIAESEGYLVTSFTDPQAALVALEKEGPFDVVLSDFMMAPVTGAEVLERAHALHPEGTRLLITAASDFRMAVEAVNRGFVFRIIPKPWIHADLVATLDAAFEQARLRREVRELNQVVSAQNAELQALNSALEQKVIERTGNVLDGLISALDYRDGETQWHSRRVSKFTRRLAQKLGVADDRLVVIEQGALLHDIGKIAVRDSILLKAGPLSPEEWAEMKTHPEAGWKMLRRIPFLEQAGTIVLQHQERWDGKGYPAGLAGETIHLGARAFSVADSYDAITSDRPYRAAAPHDVALQELRRVAGTQLDPAMVEIFCAVPESEWLAIRAEVDEEATSEKESGVANTRKAW